MLLNWTVWQRIAAAPRKKHKPRRRLIRAHGDERRWRGGELHDDMTQRLARLAIDAAKLPGGELTPSREARRSIRAGLAQLSEEVHDLSYRLHPSVLDDLGLVEARKAGCERVARSDSVRVDIDADKIPPNLPKDVALTAYRVSQEALRNIGRHAKASTVQLSVSLSEGGLRLAVSDNGSGFEPALQARRPSLGHASMRERIRSQGGWLNIRSTPGRGTTIVAWVPVGDLHETDVRVLLCGRSSMLAEGLKSLLVSEFDLIGAVEDGRAMIEATKAAARRSLADITMPI